MPSKSVKVLNAKEATNANIYRAIWNDASQEYQHRIPSADQGDIAKGFEMLMMNEYTPQRNEFVDTLVNRIGDVMFRSKTWNNPLAVFKRGMMMFGDTIEEIAGGILQAKRYDPNTCYTDVFACNKPEIMSNFHTINRQDRYDLTISEMLLRRAFVDETGLARMMDIQLQMPYNSDEYDEFLIMRGLLAEMDKVNGFYRVTVPDLEAATTQEARRDAAYQITETIRAWAGRLRFFSGNYNSSGIPTFTLPNELVLISTPEFAAAMDVNVIASAFNVSAADLNYRTIIVDTLGIDGAQAILADESLFVCADTLLEFRSIENPKGLSWNYFLHHWGIYSMSTFVNAILFTTEAGTSITVPDVEATGVTVTIDSVNGVVPEYAPLGGTLRLHAEVAGTVTPETPGYGVPQGVIWSITGTDGKPVKQLTYIDAEGVLHVAPDEQNTKLTITATSTYINPKKPMADQVYQSGDLVVGIGAPVSVEETAEAETPAFFIPGSTNDD